MDDNNLNIESNNQIDLNSKNKVNNILQYK